MADKSAVVAVVEEVELPSLETRVEWFEHALEASSEARKLSRRDYDYKDNHQWDQEDIDVLAQRKQPIITKNLIAKAVDHILGDEIDRRVDPVAKPRTPQHEDAARVATDALRYVEEQQDFDMVRSAVLQDAVIAGYGGALKEIEVCGCDENQKPKYKHKLTHIHWDKLFADPHSRSLDYGDAKYRGLVACMDLDDAVDLYPEHEEALSGALNNDFETGDNTIEDTPTRWVDSRRKRVKLVEMYFRIGENYYRSVFNKHAGDIGKPELVFYVDENGKSVCPLKMMSCYVDQEGARYGVVRALISPQDEVNKRASKSLHLLNVRQVLYERGAVTSIQKFQTEIAKPDGAAETEPGALTAGAVTITQGMDLSQGHMAMMQEAKNDIMQIGPASSQMPDLPQSASGRAFMARQKSASKQVGRLFDSLSQWTKTIYELDWMCIRQVWTEEMWMRVTDDAELTGYRFVAINRKMTRAERLQELLQKKPAPPLPSAVKIAAGTYAPIIEQDVQAQHQMMMQQAQQTGQPPPQGDQHMIAMFMQHPMMQEVITTNQVDQMEVDIIIEEAPETDVLNQEQFDTLTEMVPALSQPAVIQAHPDLIPKVVRMIVKASSLPDKREILQLFEDKPPDPQLMQQQQEAQQMQKATAQAGIAVAQSQAQLNQARSQEAMAKAQTEMPKAQAAAKHDEALAIKHAAEAGEKMSGGMNEAPIV